MAKQKFYSLWLCLICIVVFILQLIIPGLQDALVLNNKAVYNYEIWRFLTAIFLHGGIIHLMYNLFALALFGIILEKFAGSRNFLLVFFGSGIFANLISVNFYDSSLGASGAIYGILGCLTLIRPWMMVWAFSLPMPMVIAAILWAVGSVLGIFMPGNIGHIAHLSGILVGLGFGFFIRLNMPKKKKIEKIDIPETYIREWEDKYMR